MALSHGLSLTYNYGGANGLQLISITNSNGDLIQYGYNGPIVTSQTWSGSIKGQVTIAYNSNLDPASISVAGAPVSYSYDSDRGVTQAGALSITHDPASGFITGSGLGVVTDRRLFDDRGLLTNYSVTVNGASIWSTQYGYDLLGRITSRVETINSQTQSNAYIYNSAERLQQVWLNGAVNTSYGYDTNGNRLTRNTEAGTYDAQDRVLTYNGSTFAWSPNGTLLSRANGGQTTSYNYDLRGALTSVSISGGPQINYIIDGESRRIGKQVNGTLQRGWLWQGNSLVAELRGGSNVTAIFVYGADDPAPSYMISSNNTYRILSDERGSVRLVVNSATGAIAQQLAYDEFGRVVADSNPGFQPFGFAGGLYDPDTGLVQFGARDYSPETGRWTARDPLLFGGGSFNLYSYVSSDPINFTDPLGTGPSWKAKGFKPAEEWQPPFFNESEKEEGAHHAAHLLIPLATEKFLHHIGRSSAVLTANSVTEAGEYQGHAINALTELATGNKLGAANYAAKQAGNMQGENSKRMPYDPWGDLSRYLFGK